MSMSAALSEHVFEGVRRTFYSTSIDLNIVSVTVFFKYLTCNFDELELGEFKVIQGQRSWCQLTVASPEFCSKGHGRVAHGFRSSW